MGAPKSWAVQLTSVVVLTFSLLLLGIIYSFIKSARYASLKSQQSVKLELFFKDDLKPDADFQWVDQMKSLPEVLNISFITQEQAQADFKKMMISSFGSLTEEASLLSRLPSSISVQFQEGVSPDTKKQKVDEIVRLAKQIPSYDGHVYQQDWAEWLSRFSEKAERGVLVLGAFVLVIFFLIISNLIRSQVAHKQEEIEIRSFLGATVWQIESPFIFKSIIIGILSSIAAAGFTLSFVEILKNHMQTRSDLISVDVILSPNILEFSIMTVLVALIAAWAARTCVRERVLL
jgi:cell division protein FtsX